MRISDWSSDVCSSDLEGLLTARIEAAIAGGTYELGLETLQAESFTVVARAPIYTHPGTAAQTSLVTIERKDRLQPLSLDDALAQVDERGAKMLVNRETGRAAVQRRARNLTEDDGARSEEHTSELQSLMRSSYAGFCMQKKN